MKKDEVRKYFTFSRSERIGISTLLIIIAVVLIFPHIYGHFIQTSKPDFQAYDNQLEQFLAIQDSTEKAQIKTIGSKYRFTTFDPNHLPDVFWQNMGFSEKQAAVFRKYLIRNGFFCAKEDLKQVFIVDSLLYEQMLPYIQISDTFQTFLIQKKVPKQDANEFLKISPLLWKIKRDGKYNLYFSRFTDNDIKNSLLAELSRLNLSFIQVDTLTQTECCAQIEKQEWQKTGGKDDKRYEKKTFEPQPKYGKKSVKPISIELNSATIEELMQLKGIGEKLSERILKHREKLGGFYRIEQLGEVYGISPELVENLSPQILVNTASVKKISVSSSDFKTLVSHPYIDKTIANRILNCRKQGNATSADKLRYCLTPSSQDIERILEYLAFDSE
jgi:competence ComEA-like helix-hairpin-helix protein